ncbi:hypothetical protein V22_04640 [Calycomorphotria hydatis]|uniref:VWFA domain-containing protein n=2 Tax=Calycomorphotria hydatis TaxID=2528027 RepID=A0A517T4G3_9PLAN|nr:hypothetical protein V22_04640 [Calycomorphotria hydatis]
MPNSKAATSPAGSAGSRTLGERIGEAPAWLVSAGVHVGILCVLASIYSVTIIEHPPEITSTIDETELEDFKYENATVEDMVGNDSPLNITSASKAAATEATVQPEKLMQQQVQQEIAPVERPVVDEIPPPNQMELVEAVDLTGTTEHPGGVEGAVDILAQEIATSIRTGETLVMWLFDASLSLQERRNMIADRFDRIYGQVSQLEGKRAEEALTTVMATFGEGFDLVTDKPVSDPTKIINDIKSIPADTSGVENLFVAVVNYTDRFLRERTRKRKNLMLVIVTDERGDDFIGVESVITRLRRYGIRTYCVGNAAPFGREEGYVRWTYDDGFTENIPVDQGPETVAPERLQLGFWGGRFGNLDQMSSGYGPYALTRLCAETGGLYLVTDEPRLSFDPAIMKRYLPDYRPIANYERELVTNLAKAALVQAARETRANRVPTPRISFPAPDDNTLRQAVTDAQKPIAEFEYYLRRLSQIMLDGEKDRPKLTTPRWEASFDLAMGRVMAQQTRAFGYNVVLADMKGNPKSFKEKGNNLWRLVPSQEILGGPKVRKIAEKAEEYLSRVIDNHPGTPWAMIAEKELSIPMGWEWEEGYIQINTPQRNGNNNPNNNPPPERNRPKPPERKRPKL